jgi:hypothetical protein
LVVNLRSRPTAACDLTGLPRKWLTAKALSVGLESPEGPVMQPRVQRRVRISAMAANIPAGDRAGPATDRDLLAAARQGDAAALEALLVRYQPHLYRFGLRMCGNEDDAGEVAQESLISMARSLRDFRGDAAVSSWLYTIARSFCIKKRRVKSRWTRLESTRLTAWPIQHRARNRRPRTVSSSRR